jgi:hypothetical protein
MTADPKQCGERNGTFVCQFEFTEGARHAGMHYAYYISGGRAHLATWVDKWGKVMTRKAPPPARRIPWKGL